jgi:hypothetical protein
MLVWLVAVLAFDPLLDRSGALAALAVSLAVSLVVCSVTGGVSVFGVVALEARTLLMNQRDTRPHPFFTVGGGGGGDCWGDGSGIFSVCSGVSICPRIDVVLVPSMGRGAGSLTAFFSMTVNQHEASAP